MKKVVLFVFIVMISLGLKAQENSTIKVIGYSLFTPKVVAYKAEIRLAINDNSYDNPTQFKNVEELKKSYFDYLTKEGINTANFTENKIRFYASGNSYGAIKGTSLTYQTTSEEELLKLLETNYGRMVSLVYVLKKVEPFDYDKHLKIALKHAKKQAEESAEALSLKLGSIKSLEVESNIESDIWQGYSYSGGDDYSSLRVIVEYNAN